MRRDDFAENDGKYSWSWTQEIKPIRRSVTTYGQAQRSCRDDDVPPKRICERILVIPVGGPSPASFFLTVRNF